MWLRSSPMVNEWQENVTWPHTPLISFIFNVLVPGAPSVFLRSQKSRRLRLLLTSWAPKESPDSRESANAEISKRIEQQGHHVQEHVI